jgi:hypothetical protein
LPEASINWLVACEHFGFHVAHEYQRVNEVKNVPNFKKNNSKNRTKMAVFCRFSLVGVAIRAIKKEVKAQYPERILVHGHVKGDPEMYQRFELSEQDRQTIVNGVSCATLLENHHFLLVLEKSTKRCFKYRKGDEHIIVNHGGKGWWDPQSPRGTPDSSGDVFALCRRLDPAMKWHEVCTTLGALVGVEPKGAVYVAQKAERTDERSPGERWAERKSLYRGGKVWNYLIRERCLPEAIVRAAVAKGCLRDGYHAAWFAHTDAQGAVCGAELRGPETHICLGGSVKTLFRFQPGSVQPVRRLVICEAAIDALSFAALDQVRAPGTLYASTAGGMGPETIAAIQTHLAAMKALPDAVLVVATDDDDAGNAFADTLYRLADDAGVAFMRRLPPDRAKDFNQTLKNRAQAA